MTQKHTGAQVLPRHVKETCHSSTESARKLKTVCARFPILIHASKAEHTLHGVAPCQQWLPPWCLKAVKIQEKPRANQTLEFLGSQGNKGPPGGIKSKQMKTTHPLSCCDIDFKNRMEFKGKAVKDTQKNSPCCVQRG